MTFKEEIENINENEYKDSTHKIIEYLKKINREGKSEFCFSIGSFRLTKVSPRLNSKELATRIYKELKTQVYTKVYFNWVLSYRDDNPETFIYQSLNYIIQIDTNKKISDSENLIEETLLEYKVAEDERELKIANKKEKEKREKECLEIQLQEKYKRSLKYRIKKLFRLNKEEL